MKTLTGMAPKAMKAAKKEKKETQKEKKAAKKEKKETLPCRRHRCHAGGIAAMQKKETQKEKKAAKKEKKETQKEKKARLLAAIRQAEAEEKARQEAEEKARNQETARALWANIEHRWAEKTEAQQNVDYNAWVEERIQSLSDIPQAIMVEMWT